MNSFGPNFGESGFRLEIHLQVEYQSVVTLVESNQLFDLEYYPISELFLNSGT